MSPKPTTHFLFLLITFSLLHLSLSSQTHQPQPINQAHTVLTHHNFPIGLLPSTVKSYTLNATTGHFTVFLDQTCKFTLPPDNYLATYSKKITGKIDSGRISDLKGIRVWAFFKWWYITGIKISGDDLVFEVGVVTAKYPSKNFDESPACDGESRHSSS